MKLSRLFAVSASMSLADRDYSTAPRYARALATARFVRSSCVASSMPSSSFLFAHPCGDAFAVRLCASGSTASFAQRARALLEAPAAPPNATEAPAPATTPAPTPMPASCTDATKVYDPERPMTNVLFVLDRSGSMQLRVPGGGTRWTATRDALFGSIDKLATQKTRASVMQFPQGDAPLDSCCTITSSNGADCSSCSVFPSRASRCTASKYVASNERAVSPAVAAKDRAPRMAMLLHPPTACDGTKDTRARMSSIGADKAEAAGPEWAECSRSCHY